MIDIIIAMAIAAHFELINENLNFSYWKVSNLPFAQRNKNQRINYFESHSVVVDENVWSKISQIIII